MYFKLYEDGDLYTFSIFHYNVLENYYFNFIKGQEYKKNSKYMILIQVYYYFSIYDDLETY